MPSSCVRRVNSAVFNAKASIFSPLTLHPFNLFLFYCNIIGVYRLNLKMPETIHHVPG